MFSSDLRILAHQMCQYSDVRKTTGQRQHYKANAWKKNTHMRASHMHMLFRLRAL